MKSLIEKYKQGDNLSEEELDQATREMLKAYYKYKWKKKFEESEPEEQDLVVEVGLKAVKNETVSSAPPRIKFWSAKFAAAAAAVILLLILPLYFYTGSGDAENYQLLAEQYIAEDTFPSSDTRMGSEEEKMLWGEAKEAYQQKSYSEAAEKISQIAPKNQEQWFYLGLSHLYQSPSNYSKVIETLQEARKLDGRFKHEINWFLSLAYLKNEQLTEAKTELENIVKLNRWKIEEAKKLLKSL